MPANANPLRIINLPAPTAVAQFAAVDATGAQVAAGQPAIGFTTAAAKAGGAAPVCVMGSAVAWAGAAITVGQTLEIGANGSVVPRVNGSKIGTALSAAASGDQVEVLISADSSVSGAGVAAYTVDHIVSGLVLPTAGTNAAATITAGAVNIAATYIAVAGGVLGLANGDNYVDVNSTGTVVVANVAQAAAAPVLLANSIRIGFVRCAAGSVTAATTNARDSLGNWMGNRSPKAACILHAAPTAAVSSGTSYYPWDSTRLTTEVLDNANMHSLASNPSRIYCTKTGLYAVTFGLQWSSGTVQEIRLWKNGTAVQLGVSEIFFGANTTTAYGSFTGHVMLNAGDYLEVRIDATTGPLVYNASLSLVMC